MKGASNEVMMTIRNTGANSVSNRLAIKGATTPVEIPDNNSTGMANSGITSKATQYKTAGRTANLNSTKDTQRLDGSQGCIQKRLKVDSQETEKH